MGCEEFTVDLTNGEGNIDDAASWLLSVAGVSGAAPEDAWAGTPMLVYRDGIHVIEMHLQGGGAFSIRCSFALCHPQTIDQVFEDWLLRVANQFRMNIVIAEDVGPDLPFEFRYPDYTNLRKSLVPAIAAARLQWKMMFGNEEAGLTARDAVTRFVLPHAH
jgi:hypothetical protein